MGHTFIMEVFHRTEGRETPVRGGGDETDDNPGQNDQNHQNTLTSIALNPIGLDTRSPEISTVSTDYF